MKKSSKFSSGKLKTNLFKNSVSEKKLISEARRAMSYSYSIHSGFKVGAALLSSDGKIYKGTNIEFDAYSLTVCAERTALFNAVSSGARKFTKIAIAVSSAQIKYPCGLCRQSLGEFNPELEIILISKRKIIKAKLSDLLPELFKL